MAKVDGKPSGNGVAQTRLRGSVLILVVALFNGAIGAQLIGAQTFTVLHGFTGSPDGSGAAAGLTRGPDESFYGTTEGGGKFGSGTVFQMYAKGKVRIIYSFCHVENCTGDGSDPFGSVIRDEAGNLYGTTFNAAVGFFGIVFRLDGKGVETVLHSFTGLPNGDGANPGGTLLRDAAGNLYGTTEGGGLQCSQSISGCGTVFKVDASGNETVLYRFSGGSDGGIPGAGLIKGPSGNLYGTTYVGGAGCGVIFSLTRGGAESVLYSFNCSGGDGSGPLSGLIIDGHGNLFGTTAFGGSYGQGSIFEVTAAGKEEVLYSFAGSTTDGCTPLYGSLSRDGAGNLYGTTVFCGRYGNGIVFRLDSSGKETILHSFTGGADGGNPYGGSLVRKKGNLYGIAFAGGVANNGIIFKLTP
jgi:uncharacterized repeat protein (TIGR03803 family)